MNQFIPINAAVNAKLTVAELISILSITPKDTILYFKLKALYRKVLREAR